MPYITLAPLKNYRASRGLSGINHCLTLGAPVFMKSLGISACNHWHYEERVYAGNEPWHYVMVELHNFPIGN